MLGSDLAYSSAASCYKASHWQPGFSNYLKWTQIIYTSQEGWNSEIINGHQVCLLLAHIAGLSGSAESTAPVSLPVDAGTCTISDWLPYEEKENLENNELPLKISVQMWHIISDPILLVKVSHVTMTKFNRVRQCSPVIVLEADEQEYCESL